MLWQQLIYQRLLYSEPNFLEDLEFSHNLPQSLLLTYHTRFYQTALGEDKYNLIKIPSLSSQRQDFVEVRIFQWKQSSVLNPSSLSGIKN